MKYAKSAARGRGLLMAGSSLGILTFLMAAAAPAALMVAPTQALAADECGVQASDGAAITCPAGTYPTGITYSGGTVPVTIDDTAVVSDGGISLTGTTAVSLTTAVNTPDAGDLQVNNTTGAGLALSGGAITVDLTDNDSGDTAGSITGLTGVSANSTSGDINLNLGNLAITGTDPNGYSVYAVNTGTGVVNLTSGALTGDLYVSSANGMNVTTGDVTGDATISNSGADWSFSGFTLGAVSGDLNVNGALNPDGSGLWAFLNGSAASVGGNVTVSAPGGYLGITTGNVGGDVVVDGSGGNASVTAGDVAGDVLVTGSGGGSGSATAANVGGDLVVTASGGNATGNATSVAGDLVVTGDGGWASTTVGTVAGNMSLTSHNSGSVAASFTGDVTNGIVATGDTGGSVSISTSGNVSGGITATADGGGSVSISSTTGTVSGGISGTTTGGGAVNIAFGSNVTGGVTATSDTGAIGLNFSGTAASSDGYIAQMTTGGNGSITIASGATASQANFDISVGGTLSITNQGSFTGPIDFSIAPGGGTFENDSTWAAADITGSAADDSVLNGSFFGGAGTITTSGDVTWAFGAGNDSFTNASPWSLISNAKSQLLLGVTPGASNLVMTGLEHLTNGSTIVFGSKQVTLSDGSTVWQSDGETNDRLSAPGAAYSGAYTDPLGGTTSGTFLMDANLGGTGQANCSAAVDADCLDLTGGSTSGTTTIKLNIVGNGVGSLNRIVLVDVSGGTSSADAFKLDSDMQPGENLFFYRLAYDATAKQHYLTGIAGRGVYEFRQVPTSAQNVWYSSTGTYFERQADLRNQLDTGGGPGVWLRVTRALTDRQDRKVVTYGSENFDFNLDTEQDTVGVIGGVDLLRGGSDGAGYAVGVTAGHLDSKVDFKVSSGATDLKGTSYGVYGTLLAPSYFLDGIIQGNKLDVDQKGLWNTGGFAKGQAKSVGAQAEGGWRFAVNDGEAYIEPLATLSYVSTKFDNFALPGNGGSVSVPDAKSLRGSVGVRISGDADLGAVIVKLSGIGRIWDEFEGDNKTVLNSAGNKLAMTDDFSGQLNEIGVGLSFFSKSHKISGFLSTSVKFKDQYNSSDSSIGLRVQW